MFEQSAHAMELEHTYPSGAEEWYCPTCGRRMIMQWPPKYKKIVLEAGDEYATHAGGKGGIQIGGVQAAAADDLLSGGASQLDGGAPDARDEEASDDLDRDSLGPWLKWLDDADLDQAA